MKNNTNIIQSVCPKCGETEGMASGALPTHTNCFWCGQLIIFPAGTPLNICGIAATQSETERIERLLDYHRDSIAAIDGKRKCLTAEFDTEYEKLIEEISDTGCPF